MPKLVSSINPKGSLWVKFLDAWLKGDKNIVFDEFTKLKDGKSSETSPQPGD